MPARARALPGPGPLPVGQPRGGDRPAGGRRWSSGAGSRECRSTWTRWRPSATCRSTSAGLGRRPGVGVLAQAGRPSGDRGPGGAAGPADRAAAGRRRAGAGPAGRAGERPGGDRASARRPTPWPPRDGSTHEAARARRLTDRLRTSAAWPSRGSPSSATRTDRLPHIVCLGVDGVEAEPVLLGLDQAGVAAHSGSSCSSESLEPSPVLEAMGVDAERSLRLSVGWSTTDADVDAFAGAFAGGGRRGLRSWPGWSRPSARSVPVGSAAMRAVVCNELGPLDTLVVEERPSPRAAARPWWWSTWPAAGVNFVDGLICQGEVPDQAADAVRPRAARWPGTVSAVGPGCRRRGGGRPGAGVLGFGGVRRARWWCPALSLVPVPAALGLSQAAALVQSYCTDAVHPHPAGRRWRPGEWVLVLGAGGGIGLAAVDVARALGRPGDRRRLHPGQAGGGRGHGGRGHHRLRGRGPEGPGPGAVRRRGRRGGRPGGRTPQPSRPCGPPARSGRFCVIGFASGPIPAVPLNQVLLNNRTVVGVDWGGVDLPGSRWSNRAPPRRADGHGGRRPAPPDRAGRPSAGARPPR